MSKVRVAHMHDREREQNRDWVVEALAFFLAKGVWVDGEEYDRVHDLMDDFVDCKEQI